MSTGFQFYEGSATESAEVAKITVRRGGMLVLTRAAVAMLGEGATHVQVGFNPDTGAVGLRRAEKGEKGSYRLRSQRNSVSRLVDGKRVFAHHDLTAEKARSFDVESFGDDVIGFVYEPAPDGAASNGDAAPARKATTPKK